MGKLEKIVAGLAVVAILGVTIYNLKRDESNDYIYGTVIEEAGTIVDRQKAIERSEGALFGNDSVKFGNPTYAIKIKADDEKIYTLAVRESYRGKLEALNLAVNPGTRVKVHKSAWGYNHKVGSIRDDKLYILDEEE